MRSRTRLAADIGGTFTDVAAFDQKSGRLLLGKALSTPARLVDGISHGIDKAETRVADASLFLHGSTVAINTILERSGARTALLITEGFRDIYEIGRINRPDAYNLFFRKHVPLVARALCFEVRERLTAEGEVLVPLDEASVHAACDRMLERGIEAVAILLLHSYVNRAHEARVKAIVRERLPPHAFVTSSHELSQEYREFERCSTVAANAYIGPRVSAYIAGIDRHLQASGFDGKFLLVQSTGGLYEEHQAREQCVRILESGPAAGVIGARALCRSLGLTDAIAFDMGGTTAKAGVIYGGEVLTSGAALIGRYAEALPVQIPMIDIFEVGTGGGSIARLENGDALKVGPQSAGAEPGPACYGRGGMQPTVTDANLVLGRLAPDRFLGGEMRLDLKAAQRAIASIAEPLGLSVTRAAEGILRIAATAMSYAVKGVSTDRGLDAAAFAMVAYGGAGPLHAGAIAREIGIGHIIVPRAPGHFCAFGMLHSDLRYDYVRTWFTRLDDASFDDIERAFEQLVARGRHALKESGVAYGKVRVTYAADMRYVGQEHAVAVDLGSGVFKRRDRDAIKRQFDDVHLRRYGTSAPQERAEIVSLRATVTGLMKKPPLERIARGARAPVREARTGKRKVWFEGRPVLAESYARHALRAGNRVQGPALIEEYASTTVVMPGDRLEVDGFGNLHIEAERKT